MNNEDPVQALLTVYGHMSENEIKCHIQDWWFNLDAVELFNKARESGMIQQDKGGQWRAEWSLTKKTVS